MAERISTKNKNSSTVTPAAQTSVPLLQRHAFTNTKNGGIGTNSTLSNEQEAAQPSFASAKFDLGNVSLFAPAAKANSAMASAGAIQRQEEKKEKPEDVQMKPEGQVLQREETAESEAKKPEEVTAKNAKISPDEEVKQQKVARASFDLANVSVFPKAVQRQEAEGEKKEDDKAKVQAKSEAEATPQLDEEKKPQDVQMKEAEGKASPQEEEKKKPQDVQKKEVGGKASPQEEEEKKKQEELKQKQAAGKLSPQEEEEKKRRELLMKSVQTKLAVGKPGDKYEQEADSAAAKVMTMPEKSIQRQAKGEEEEVQAQSLGNSSMLQRQAEGEEEEVQAKPLINTISPMLQRQAEGGEEEEVQAKPLGNSSMLQRQAEGGEEEEVQAKPLGNSSMLQRQAKGEEEVQMKSSGVQQSGKGGGLQATSGVETSLANSKGGGSPLPDEVKGFMEPRFGADFSGVRVHTDSTAVQMNKELGAQAFAHGSDIYYGAGKSPGKDELTAHELTHTIQQTGGVQPFRLNNKQQKQSQPEVQGEMLQAKEAPWMRQEAKQTESAAVEPVNNKVPSNSSAANPAGDAGGMGSDGQGEQPGSQKGAALNAEDPGQIIEQLKNTPPTEAAAAYNQAQATSGQALENQKQQVKSTLPEIPAPTGLPPKETAEGEKADAPQGQTPEANEEEANGEQETNTSSLLDFLAKIAKNNEEHNKEIVSLPEIPSSSNGNIQDIGNINTSIGERPQVDLSGEADPAQMDATEAESHQEVQDSKTQAAEEIDQDFGENNIFPEPSDEILTAKHQFAEISPPSEKIGKLPTVPPEAVGSLNQGLTPFYQEKIAPEQEKYKVGKEKFEADSDNEKANANNQVESLNEEAKQKELEEQKKTRQEVTQAKSNWQSELDKVDKDYQDKAGKATKEQQQKIDDEKAKAEAEADQHLTKAEQDAEAEKKKGEEEARRKEEEARRPKSFWEKVGDFFEDIWEGIKQAFTTIFNAIRDAIKAIYEAVKQVVMAVIDLARQVIVGIIQGLGEILKGIVQIALAAFPEIAKKFTEEIDNAVNKAVEVVNSVADWLKKAVSDVLDFLAKTLDKLLGVLQDLFIGLLSVIWMIITGDIDELINGFSNLVEAAKAMPPQFETAGLEELMGGDIDLDKPLSPEELAQAQQAGIDIPGAAGEGNSQTSEAGELPHAPWTEENVGVDGVENNMELSPELAAELMQKTNGDGEVMLAESDDQSRSMDSIMAEAAEQQRVGGEQEVQQHLDDGLSPKQRADIKWQLMKEGIKQWFSQNWPKLLAGLIAAGAVIIVAIVASGGAVLAALPMILEVLAIVFAAEAIAKITGYLRDYLTKGWAGDIQGGGKSLAKALAAGAIELAMLLTFEAGKVAVKGGKAIAKGVKTVAKGAVKVATKAFRGIIKGIKYIIEKGKVLFKGIAGTGVGKQFNKLQDFGRVLLERMRFRAFRIRVANRRFRLEGLINPWVIIAEGLINPVTRETKKATFVTDDELKAVKEGGTPKTGGDITEREIVDYGTSNNRAVVGDKLTGDHIPSSAALIKANENELFGYLEAKPHLKPALDALTEKEKNELLRILLKRKTKTNDINRIYEMIESTLMKTKGGSTSKLEFSEAAKVRNDLQQAIDNDIKPRKNQIEEEGLTIVIPEQLHKNYSRTFGGKNQPPVIAEDAINLGAAFKKDIEAMFKGLEKERKLTPEYIGAYMRLYRENVAKGVFVHDPKTDEMFMQYLKIAKSKSDKAFREETRAVLEKLHTNNELTPETVQKYQREYTDDVAKGEFIHDEETVKMLEDYMKKSKTRPSEGELSSAKRIKTGAKE